MGDKGQTQKEKVAIAFGRITSPDFGAGDLLFTAMGRRLVERAQIPLGAQVLDVAAGRGASLFPAAKKVGVKGRVIGIDLARAMVQKTASEIQKRGTRNAEMRQMDAEQLEFSKASFDCVLCGFALFFFPRLAHTLAGFCQVLKPGGQFAATIFGQGPVAWPWYERLLQTHGITRPGPVRDLFTRLPDTPSGLEAAFRQAGFAEIQIIPQRVDVIYKDEADWWSRLWSSGDGAILGELDSSALDRFKADAFKSIQEFKGSDGIHRTYQVLFILAKRPVDGYLL